MPSGRYTFVPRTSRAIAGVATFRSNPLTPASMLVIDALGDTEPFVSVQTIDDAGADSYGNTSGNAGTFGEVGIDSYSTAATAVQTLADFVLLADALTSTGTGVESIADAGIDSYASSGTGSESLSERLADAIGQVALGANSILEVAQDGVQSVTGASESGSETAIELLTLLTSGQHSASFVEIEGDFLSSSATLVNSISDTVLVTVVDSLLSIGVSLQDIIDLVISDRPPIVWPPFPIGRRRVTVKRSRDEVSTLERQAEVIIERKELPDSYPVGAHKAYEAFQDFYGSEEGRRIFIKKALEQGRGETVHEKIADVFKTGAKVDQTKKLDTRVQVIGKNGPNVAISPLRGNGVTILKR